MFRSGLLATLHQGPGPRLRLWAAQGSEHSLSILSDKGKLRETVKPLQGRLNLCSAVDPRSTSHLLFCLSYSTCPDVLKLRRTTHYLVEPRTRSHLISALPNTIFETPTMPTRIYDPFYTIIARAVTFRDFLSKTRVYFATSRWPKSTSCFSASRLVNNLQTPIQVRRQKR